MARTTVNPTDQLASAQQTGASGTVTDTATSSPATGTQNNVSVRVNVTCSAYLEPTAGTRTGTAKVEYSTNGGGAWSDLPGSTASRQFSIDGTGTTTVGPLNLTLELGDGIDVANIQVRASAQLSGVNVQALDDVNADVNSWSISYGEFARAIIVFMQ